MKKFNVISRAIKYVVWFRGLLYVVFHNGAMYRYENVPGEVFLSLLEATSVGRFFNKAIVGRFKGHKVAHNSPAGYILMGAL